MIPLHEIEFNSFGGSPVCEHSMPCAVCCKVKAVYDMSAGHFLPCWGCQKAGWRTERIQTVWWKRMLGIKPVALAAVGGGGENG